MDIPLDQDHDLLGIQYCTGYVDKKGNWKTGFYCPNSDTESSGIYCCGDRSQKYCCNENPFAAAMIPTSRYVSTGNLVAVTMVTFILTTLLTYAWIVCCKRVWKWMSGRRQFARNQTAQMTSSTAPNVSNMSCSTSMSINGLAAVAACNQQSPALPAIDASTQHNPTSSSTAYSTTSDTVSTPLASTSSSAVATSSNTSSTSATGFLPYRMTCVSVILEYRFVWRQIEASHFQWW